MKIRQSRDSEGYLVEPDDWSAEIAHELANQEGIELNDDYWPIIHYIRNYYFEHGITPDIRHVNSYLASELGCSKKEAKKLIFDLFPYGYVKQACKIAGMKKPRAWSTG